MHSVTLLLAGILANSGASTIANASESATILLAIKRCPSAENLAELTRSGAEKPWQDLATCAAACAADVSNLKCCVLHFSIATNRCFHGNAMQFSTLWGPEIAEPGSSVGSSSCVSYAKSCAQEEVAISAGTTTKGTMEQPVTTSAVTNQLNNVPGFPASLSSKLIIMYDFRRSFANLVDSSKFPITLHGGVTRDTNGASFSQPVDYLEVDTAGGSLASAYLTSTSSFTFFVSAKRRTWYQATYHYFYQCSNPGTYTGRFADRSQRIWVEHPFPSQSRVEIQKSSGGPPLDTTNKMNMATLGVTFINGTVAGFYLNGSMQAKEASPKWSYTNLPSCLRIGFDAEPSYGLNGQLICYAVAKSALGLADMQQLEAYCTS